LFAVTSHVDTRGAIQNSTWMGFEMKPALSLAQSNTFWIAKKYHTIDCFLDLDEIIVNCISMISLVLYHEPILLNG